MFKFTVLIFLICILFTYLYSGFSSALFFTAGILVGLLGTFSCALFGENEATWRIIANKK